MPSIDDILGPASSEGKKKVDDILGPAPRQVAATAVESKPGLFQSPIESVKEIGKDIAEDYHAGAETYAEGVRGLTNPAPTVGGRAWQLADIPLGLAESAGSVGSGAYRAIAGDPIRKAVPGTAGKMIANAGEAITGLAGPSMVKAGGETLKAIHETATAERVAKDVKKAEALNPQAQQAHDSGYVLPPHLATKEPGKLADVAGGMGGATRIEQAASVRNQPVTNAIAARDLGVPEGTRLTPEVFDEVRADAGKAYEAVKQAVPVIEIGSDKKYAASIAQLNGPSSRFAEYFPTDHPNTAIEDLKKSLLFSREVPTQVLVDKVKALRHDSNINFKALGDTEKFGLALAQRDAANALEDAMDRGITNSDKYFGKVFGQAGKEEAAALKEAAQANQRLTAALGKEAKTSNIYQVNAALRSQQEASASLQKAMARLESARAKKAAASERLKLAQNDTTRNELVGKYREARTRIAKSYDVEAATNPATGDVDARKLGSLLKKGKPLSGGLKAMAESSLAFPRAFQDPARFGGDKPMTVLDFFAMAEALGHGHPGVAAAVAARPLARSAILSKRYQRGMFPSGGRSAPSEADPLVSPDEGAGLLSP